MTDTQTSHAEEHRSDDSLIATPGDPEQSVYRFIIIAAKRARQLQSGSRPKIQHHSRKMTRIAIDEVRRGLIPFFDPVLSLPEPVEAEEVTDQ